MGPRKKSKPNPKAENEAQTTITLQGKLCRVSEAGTESAASIAKESKVLPSLGELGTPGPSEPRKTWYGGTWPRTPKAIPVTQVAKESISAAGAAAPEAISSAQRRVSPRRAKLPRSPTSYLPKGLASSSRSLPIAATITKLHITSNSSNLSDASSRKPTDCQEPSIVGKGASDAGGSEERNDPEATSGDMTIEDSEKDGPKKSSADLLDAEDKRDTGGKDKDAPSGWMGWFSKTSNDKEMSQRLKTQNDGSSVNYPSTSQQPANGQLAKSGVGEVAAASTTSLSNGNTFDSNISIRGRHSTDSHPVLPAINGASPARSWLGFWNYATTSKESGSAATKAPSSIPQKPVETERSMNVEPDKTNTNSHLTSEAPEQPADAGKSYGWAFWLKEPTDAGDTRKSGTASVEESAFRPPPAQLETETTMVHDREDLSKSADIGDKPVTCGVKTLSPQCDESQSVAKHKQKVVNLLLPQLNETYRTLGKATLLQQLGQLLQYKKSPSGTKHVHLQDPPRVKRALAIGVHGYFPAPLIQKVLGQPTGTSIRFANGAANAMQRWAAQQGYSFHIEKVALEGEGKILERLELLWKLLLNWLDDIRKADFIMIACHSQGVPVAIMLIAKLISFGCLHGTRVGVCAMAGVNLGPFGDYKSRWISGTAGELFEFARPDSQVSVDYEAALDVVLRFGARITFVGSIDDQLVSLESSTFGTVSHPLIYRAVFVDGRIHAPDFLSHLVGFALKLRNLGIPDHGLIRELSTPLAGSLYGGEGHSRIYDDEVVYHLAVRYALETTSLGELSPQFIRDGPANPQNPYILPFAMRGLLEEDYVRTELHDETTELLRQFDDWRPLNKPLKDVKYRLEGSRPLKTRKQVVVNEVPNTSKTFTRALSASNVRASPTLQDAKNRFTSKPPSIKAQAQKSKKRPSPAQARLESDSDDESGTENDAGVDRKRAKLSTEPHIDIRRQIRSRGAFSEDDNGLFTMVHSANIASLGEPTKYRAAFPNSQTMTVSLQYPSASQTELYELVEPIHYDDFHPLEEVREILMIVADHYLPSTAQASLNNENSGLLRRLKLATTKGAGDDYVGLVQEWNELITGMRKKDVLAGMIDTWTSVDLKLIERILNQTYARTVSPRINSLRQYENGTDNVYGELLPKFISEILRKDTKMTSEQVFVDLGSGVGNVVLQAALQVGCESWGCEMMENACDLAALQQLEFGARCRLWGLTVGAIHLERGDFLENREIGKVLKRADVILVNNQAFTPQLNEALTSLFLDAKEGCQIVSLKSFVPSGHKITSRNLYRACNVLDVTEKRYYSSCVSWTDAPGSYYVSVKDSSRVAAFANQHV